MTQAQLLTCIRSIGRRLFICFQIKIDNQARGLIKEKSDSLPALALVQEVLERVGGYAVGSVDVRVR